MLQYQNKNNSSTSTSTSPTQQTTRAEESNTPVAPKELTTNHEIKALTQEKKELEEAAQLDSPEIENQKIDIKTQKFHVVFNTLGGTIDSLELVNIKKDYTKESTDYKLIEKKNNLAIGVLTVGGFDDIFQNASFTITTTKAAEGIIVNIQATKQGIQIEKIIEFFDNEYDFKFKIKITNLRQEAIKNNLSLIGVQDMEFNFLDTSSLLSDQIVTLINDDGDLISAGDMHFWSKTYGARQSLTSLHEEPFFMGPGRKTPKGKHDQAKVVWAGLKNRYFAMIYKPEKDTWAISGHDNNKETTKVENTLPQMTLIANTATIDSNQTYEGSFIVYAGPTKTTVINSERYKQDHFVEVIDYGFMFPRFIKVFEGILNFIVNTIKLPYWLSVILLTLLVRMLMFPITKRASMSQAKLQTVAPKMKELREKYKNDNRKLNEEMMKLYRTEGVNPFTSCLPMFIQMPIFFGLYYTFNLNYDVRFQSFLWIKDLAVHDQLFIWGADLPLLGTSFNLLPIIYSVINYITMHNMPPAQDEMQIQQQRIMKYVFPVMMLLFFYRMPAALVLYFIVSGTWSVIEQKKIRQRLELMKAK